MSVGMGVGNGLKWGSDSRARSKLKSNSNSRSKAAYQGVCAAWANATSKQRGELAEMMFMVKATQEGFATAKPYGDSRRYDFIVDTGSRLWRVQVKSASTLFHGAYHANAWRHQNGRAIAYTTREIDLVVAYVMPENSWFVIPINACKHRQSLLLYPRNDPREGPYDHYREAWALMRNAAGRHRRL